MYISDFNINVFIDKFKTTCSKTQIKSFNKNEIITTYIEKRNQICILLNGEAELIRYDLNGNKTIIGHFEKNQVFGELFYPANTNNELFVISKSKSEVLFFMYDDILSKCKKNCPFHQELSASLTKLILKEVVDLNTRIELLTKRNIRDKLVSYFNLLSSKTLAKSITLPFSYTDLADYLSIDRSAMSRELKSLEDENFIQRNGKKINLLYK